MKKFFTCVPLQPSERFKAYKYEAVDNDRLALEKVTHFPIINVINGYAESGDEIQVIAVVTDNEDCRKNYEVLEEEIREICKEKNITCPKGVEKIMVPADEAVETELKNFQKVTDYVSDDDALYACMTYGTKTLSMIIMMAIQYAYRVMKNTSIDCIVYGQINREDREHEKAKVFDMTALVKVNELINILAPKKVKNAREIIEAALNF